MKHDFMSHDLHLPELTLRGMLLGTNTGFRSWYFVRNYLYLARSTYAWLLEWFPVLANILALRMRWFPWCVIHHSIASCYGSK